MIPDPAVHPDSVPVPPSSKSLASAIKRWIRRAARAPRATGRGAVRIYQYTLSPLVGFHCRHLPTCSAYAD
jgi:hypothetical protein